MSQASISSRTVVRALDGSMLDVEGLDPGVAGAWGFRAWYSSQRLGSSVLLSTVAGAHENSPLPDTAIVSEAKSGSVRLLAFANPIGTDHPTMTFVYQDRYHELYTTQGGSGIPMDVFVDFLKPLAITDSEEGIEAVPRPGANASVNLHVGSTMVPDVAIVTSYFTEQALADVPTHEGQQAYGGQLWRLEEGGAVLLANSSVATTLRPMKEPDAAGFQSLAESLSIVRRTS